MKTRALTRRDGEAITRLYRGLSERSRALRFGVPTPTLSAWTLCELVTLDGSIRSAVGVFTEDGVLVAEGRWVRLFHDPSEAEAAFTVADDFQRQGLGTHLLGRVVEAASEAGIARLHFTVSGENRGMAALLRRRGITVRYSGGSGEATLRLAPAVEAAAGPVPAWRTA